MLEFPPIKDIAPPVEPSAAAAVPWLWWAGVAVTSLLLLYSCFVWLQGVGRRAALPRLPARAEKRAIKELHALRKRGASLGADAFAAQLSDIIRTFLHRNMGVLARFSTSPEILGDRPRADQPPPPPAVAAFREVLTASDALKYGPQDNNRNAQTDSLIDAAISAVRAACNPVPAGNHQATASGAQMPPLPPDSGPPRIPETGLG